MNRSQLIRYSIAKTNPILGQSSQFHASVNLIQGGPKLVPSGGPQPSNSHPIGALQKTLWLNPITTIVDYQKPLWLCLANSILGQGSLNSRSKSHRILGRLPQVPKPFNSHFKPPKYRQIVTDHKPLWHNPKPML